MDLMCPSLIIFRASGLSTNTQCKTSRIPKEKIKKENMIKESAMISVLPFLHSAKCNYYALNVLVTRHCDKGQVMFVTGD